MPILHHNEKITMNGVNGTVGTVEGYAIERGKVDIQSDVNRAIANHHELAWTLKRATILSDSREYYEREDAAWAITMEIKDGQAVTIEGRKYTAKFMGKQYSDFVKFIPA